MQTLRPMDLNFICTRIPRDIRQLIISTSGLVLAGGFIRSTIANEKVSDLDLFGPSKDALKAIAYKLATERKGRVHESDNALTILAPPRMPIQFITRWTYTDPEDIIKSFDFTVCQAAVWFKDEKWHSQISDDFYPDLAARRLVYTFPVREEMAGGSFMRVKKFLTRGYTIQPLALAGVLSRIFEKVDRDRLESSECSNGAGLVKIIAGVLREVDPLVVIDGVDFIDEHQVIQDEARP